MTDLPVDIDSTFPDRSAGDALHQQHHDFLHALYNELKGSDSAAGVATLQALLDGTYQPANANLSEIAALVTTAYGRGLLTDADAAAFKARLRGLLDSTYVVPDLLPWVIQIDPVLALASVNVGFPTIGVSSGWPYIYNNGNQNSSLAWDVVLAAGTWTIDITAFKKSDAGIVSVQLDDGAGVYTTVGNADFYDASTIAAVRLSVTGVVVGSTIRRRLRLLVATKNPSSTNYTATLHFVALRRTA